MFNLYKFYISDVGLIEGTLQRAINYHSECLTQKSKDSNGFHNKEIRQLEKALKCFEDGKLCSNKVFTSPVIK